MSEPGVVHSTFVLERRYPASLERVYAAFAKPELRRRWFAEGRSHTVEEYAMEFREGGAERVLYRFGDGTPFPGVALTNDGTYLDIVPNRRIVTSSAMAMGGRRISASLVTIELLATDGGTDLICTHQGAFFEGADGPEMREQGWRTLLDRLSAELERPTEG